MSQEEIERLMGSMSAAPAPEPAPQPAQAYQAASPQPVYQQPVYQPPVQEPRVINSKPVALPNFAAAESLGAEQKENLELIMSVPLEVSVEIGRTRRKVEDILTFSKGSLVVLDKLAGDQVDVLSLIHISWQPHRLPKTPLRRSAAGRRMPVTGGTSPLCWQRSGWRRPERKPDARFRRAKRVRFRLRPMGVRSARVRSPYPRRRGWRSCSGAC